MKFSMIFYVGCFDILIDADNNLFAFLKIIEKKCFTLFDLSELYTSVSSGTYLKLVRIALCKAMKDT